MKSIKQLLCILLAVMLLTGLVLPGRAVGQILSGTVTSYGDESEEITLQLIPEGSEEVAYELTVTGNSTSYSFVAIAEGTYSLVASKYDHVTRGYDITVSDTDATLNVKLCLPGDVTGDGRINVADVGRVYGHVKKSSTLTGYALLCADLTGEGRVNVADTGKVYNIVKNGLTTTAKAVTISVWTPSYDREDSDGWLYAMEEAFQKANPKYKITWENGIYHEGDAGYLVTEDPAAAADVYMFANDQLGMLVEAGGIVSLEGAQLEQVLADNSQTMINTVTYTDGNVYGFPMTNNTWFMYYNKEVFTAEDVKSLDTMLEKGTVAFPWSTAWYGGTFFLANGGEIFGQQGNDASAGIQFGAANGGYEAAEKMVQLANHPNMLHDTDGIGVSGLVDGSVDAFFSGSWDYSNLYENLGDALGAAQLPTVEIGGEQKQMKAFAGSKAIGVNPYADEPELVAAFAAFLATPESQKLRYEKSNIIPAAAELAQDADIQENIVAVAEINTISNASVVQPSIPEMANYWSPMGNFGAMMVYGEVTEENYMEQVDQLMTELNPGTEEDSGSTDDDTTTEDSGEYSITLRLHYHREDGDYEGWELWVWDASGVSAIDPPYEFVEEDGEMVATVPVQAGTCEVGYIVRLGDWVEKDIAEDQFIDVTGVLSGTVDVYVESGVKGHTVVLGDDVVTGGDDTSGSETIVPEGNDPDGVPLRVWAAPEDQYSSDSWLIQMEEAFMAANPDYRINWVNEHCSEGDAGYYASMDPQAAADVYLYANDQLGGLMAVDGLVKLEGDYLNQVLADNSQILVNTVTYTDGNVYGFPVANNTWFMYYNKEVFTEEDVKSLDTMLEKGTVAFPWGVAWYSGTFFMANGGTLFGEEGNDASAGIQFGAANGGYEAAEAMIRLAADPNFVADTDMVSFSEFMDGNVDAYFSGYWDYPALVEHLGDSLGAAQPPMVEIGGEQKQMKAFAGSKAVGVNAYSAQQELALEFASFLASPASQKVRYESRGIVPAASALAEDELIQADILAVAQMNTIANASVVQPFIPEMANYWTPVGNFGISVAMQEINADNYQQAVDQLMTALNPGTEEDSGSTDNDTTTEDPGEYSITLRLHYHREDGNYEGWELWAWDASGVSAIDPPYEFVEEDGEMVATVPVQAGTCEVGYIVRLGNWEDKDIAEDQFIDVTGVLSGTVDVYVESGVKGHTVVLGDDVVTGYIIADAAYRASSMQVMVRMSAAITDYTVDTETFTVTGDQGKVLITDVKRVGQYYYLILEEALESGTYTVSFEGLSKSFTV